MLIGLLVLAYRPANVFLPARASTVEVHVGIDALCNRLHNSSLPTIRRSQVVTNDAEDIVFDALSGSRSGIVSTDHSTDRLRAYRANPQTFDRDLRKAQTSVLAAQLSYVLCQCTAVAVVCRVLLDVTTHSA